MMDPINRNESALDIQRVTRGWKARERYRVLHHRREVEREYRSYMATRIQLAWKCRVSRDALIRAVEVAEEEAYLKDLCALQLQVRNL
jgi:hypothetical protein